MSDDIRIGLKTDYDGKGMSEARRDIQGTEKDAAKLNQTLSETSRPSPVITDYATPTPGTPWRTASRKDWWKKWKLPAATPEAPAVNPWTTSGAGWKPAPVVPAVNPWTTATGGYTAGPSLDPTNQFHQMAMARYHRTHAAIQGYQSLATTYQAQGQGAHAQAARQQAAHLTSLLLGRTQQYQTLGQPAAVNPWTTASRGWKPSSSAATQKSANAWQTMVQRAGALWQSTAQRVSAIWQAAVQKSAATQQQAAQPAGGGAGGSGGGAGLGSMSGLTRRFAAGTLIARGIEEVLSAGKRLFDEQVQSIQRSAEIHDESIGAGNRLAQIGAMPGLRGENEAESNYHQQRSKLEALKAKRGTFDSMDVGMWEQGKADVGLKTSGERASEKNEEAIQSQQGVEHSAMVQAQQKYRDGQGGMELEHQRAMVRGDMQGARAIEYKMLATQRYNEVLEKAGDNEKGRAMATESATLAVKEKAKMEAMGLAHLVNARTSTRDTMKIAQFAHSYESKLMRGVHEQMFKLNQQVAKGYDQQQAAARHDFTRQN